MEKPKYITNAGQIRPMTFNHISNELSKGYYSIEVSPQGYLYLQSREEFQIPNKIYGNRDFPKIVKDTYSRLGRGLAVLLSGPKGTGKTVDAKLICMNSEKPVLMINHPISSDLADFIESIHTPSVIFIDEFEKIYPDEDTRNMFLTILDGTSQSRHLFVLTSNQERIGEYFENRPNRIRYHKKYKDLSDELIEEIIDDKLLNHEFRSDILKTVNNLSSISMDSLTCIIEECDLRNIPPSEFMEYFNVQDKEASTFDLRVKKKIFFFKSQRIEEENIQFARVEYEYRPDGKILDFEYAGFDDIGNRNVYVMAKGSQIKKFTKTRKNLEVEFEVNYNTNNLINEDMDSDDHIMRIEYAVYGVPSKTYRD